MNIIKECECCHKKFSPTAIDTGILYCKKCYKKIKHEVHKRRIKQHPFNPYEWNTTSVAEVKSIVAKIQSKIESN